MVIFHGKTLVYQRVKYMQTRDAFAVRQMIDLWLLFLKMVILHGFLYVYQRVSLLFSHSFMVKYGEILHIGHTLYG